MLILPLILSTMAIYKGSQIVNEVTAIDANEPTQTLTHQSYIACQAGDKDACLRDNIFTVVFAPVDKPIALLTGGSIMDSHGKTWLPIDEALPTISQKKDNYGGAKYNQFQQFYKE